jgi:hypothetical protein
MCTCIRVFRACFAIERSAAVQGTGAGWRKGWTSLAAQVILYATRRRPRANQRAAGSPHHSCTASAIHANTHADQNEHARHSLRTAAVPCNPSHVWPEPCAEAPHQMETLPIRT